MCGETRRATRSGTCESLHRQCAMGSPSDAIKASVESRGLLFADMNKEIMPFGQDVAFYTDYAHLTVDGNRIVAHMMGDLIIKGGLTQ